MALSIHDREIRERRIRPLVTQALLDEHRERPFGPHSPALAEVLDFVRRNPDPERPRYLLLDLGGRWAVAARASAAGGDPIGLGGAEHASRGRAEHDVLRRRLRDVGLLDAGGRPTTDAGEAPA
ncbi:MAG: hypothetical protein AB7G37_17485 [Solirubrobacteraceae bacterium]